jgi:leucyl/phenylalanyl-tRNA---protein transferase
MTPPWLGVPDDTSRLRRGQHGYERRYLRPVPIEPPASPWSFAAEDAGDQDLVGAGADLQPGTVLAAYRSGVFPMPVDDGAMLWWSPASRAILPLSNLRVSRSLARSVQRFEIRVDTAFDEVLTACADPAREGGWIDGRMIRAYGALYRLGWVHSVEAWRDGELAGGLYGVSIGGLFAGESMFHRRTDASKAALVALVELLRAPVVKRLLDVQWLTPHLTSLGAVAIPRRDYLERLREALDQSPPDWPDPQ